MRERLAEWHRQRARVTEQELTPRVTFALLVTCTVVFAWQVLSFGIVASIPEMPDSGAATMDLVRSGEPWPRFGMTGALLEIDPHGRTQTEQFAHWLGALGIVSLLAPGVATCRRSWCRPRRTHRWWSPPLAQASIDLRR